MSKRADLREDLKPGNILLEIDDHEDLAHHGSTQSRFDESTPLEASSIRSEAIETKPVDLLKTVKVRIVDFGVCELA